MKKVLVVDDDLEVLVFASAVLRGVYEGLFAEDSVRGLALARETRPDVIVLDVIMPGSPDGFLTFCELRKDPETSAIPVIMLSSINEVMDVQFNTDTMEQHLHSAPAAFLEKPVTSDSLLTAIGDALRKD